MATELLHSQVFESDFLTQIASNLEHDEKEDLWIARDRSAIAYPDDGNEGCLQIEENSFWFRHRNRAIVDVMRLYPPAGTVYDIGGGNGFVALGIQNAGFPVVVVEPGIEGARNARRRGLNPVICASVQDAHFKPASLSAVGMFDVLEHIEDDIGTLSLLRELLSDDGRLYLTVPAYQWLWSEEDVYAQHYRRYSLRSLRELFSRAGFVVEFQSYLFSPLPLPVFLLRVLPSRVGLRRTGDLERYKRDHGTSGGVMERCLSRLLSVEYALLRKGIPMPIGGSCLVVARVAPRRS